MSKTQKAKTFAFPRHLDRYDIQHSASCPALLNQTHSALFWRRCFRSASSVKFLMALSRLLATRAAAVDSWTTHMNHAVICIHHKAAVDSWTTHTNHAVICIHHKAAVDSRKKRKKNMQSSASTIKLLWTPEQHTWTMDSWTTHTNHAVICIHYKAAVDSWTTHMNHAVICIHHKAAVDSWTTHMNHTEIYHHAGAVDSWTTHMNNTLPRSKQSRSEQHSSSSTGLGTPQVSATCWRRWAGLLWSNNVLCRGYQTEKLPIVFPPTHTSPYPPTSPVPDFSFFFSFSF